MSGNNLFPLIYSTFALKNTARAQSLNFESIYSIAYTSEDFGRPRSSSAYRWRHASSLEKSFRRLLQDSSPRPIGYENGALARAAIAPIIWDNLKFSQYKSNMLSN